MLAKKAIKKIVYEELPHERYTQEYFLRLHQHLEAYLKHLLLIGVRKQFKAEYDLARRVINSANVPFNDASFVHAFRFLGFKQSWIQFKKANQEVAILAQLCFQYASKVRNMLLHGSYYTFQHGEVVLLVRINKLFVQKLEKGIGDLSGGKQVLIHAPGDFGAPKGRPMEERELRRLLRFGLGKKPMSYQKALDLYHKALQYT